MNMSFNKVHFSSQSGDWKTPKALYQCLDAEFHFDFDPCPNKPLFDGLEIEWGQCNYVNPPYGKAIKAWMAKCVEQWRKGKIIVALIPSRTDSAWWHNYVMQASEIRFVRGRLCFNDGQGRAPFPSAIVIWNK